MVLAGNRSGERDVGADLSLTFAQQRRRPRASLKLIRALPLLAITLSCDRPAEPPQPVRPDAASAQAPAQDRLEPVDAGAPKLLPRDDADSSFRAFRVKALHALNSRDTSFLYNNILTRDVKNGAGNADGIAGFKRVWRMDAPKSLVWDALARVLRLGGKQVNDNIFIAPYTHAFWPDSIDPSEYVAITSEHARVYEQPEFAAVIVGTTSHVMVKLVDWRSIAEAGAGSASAWARIELPDGRQGWVKADDVYSPVGWHAHFVKRGGRWRLDAFMAGRGGLQE